MAKKLLKIVKEVCLGPARDIHDPGIHHKLSLAALLAWIGLGADGLSSSSYGPEEAFRALGDHFYLAPFLILATIITVSVISFTYGKIIEIFPHGGGGYAVASTLLGKKAGVVSGCALFVDYILTITISIASGGDAVFSFLPQNLHHFKLFFEIAAIVFLLVLNLRGVKDSVISLVPIFFIFFLTHTILIVCGILFHANQVSTVANELTSSFNYNMHSIGGFALFLIFIKAYTLGAGTYTGIEAVSNGVGVLREPKVKTGKRTMLYMSTSLAFLAGGLLLCYLLYDVRHVPGQTFNAVLAQRVGEQFNFGGFSLGSSFAFITILSEAALLIVAAQTGFLDGPRVMANMATDRWLPRKFSFLSDRLTMQNGILLMGIAAILMLIYTRGKVGFLVVLYSLNVFLTFTLSQAGMLNYWWKRKNFPGRIRGLTAHGIAFLLCFFILMAMVIQKFSEGAWVTLIITSSLVAFCFWVRHHYESVGSKVREIDKAFSVIPPAVLSPAKDEEFDQEGTTAVILIGGSAGLGHHVFLNIFRIFPNTFKNAVFLSVGVVDSDFFKEATPVSEIETETRHLLQNHVDFSKRMGIPARMEFKVGTEVVESVVELCTEVYAKYPHSVFFSGEIVFENPQWYQRWLHNETSYAIMRKIRFQGIPMVILPIRIHA